LFHITDANYKKSRILSVEHYGRDLQQEYMELYAGTPVQAVAADQWSWKPCNRGRRSGFPIERTGLKTDAGTLMTPILFRESAALRPIQQQPFTYGCQIDNYHLNQKAVYTATKERYPERWGVFSG